MKCSKYLRSASKNPARFLIVLFVLMFSQASYASLINADFSDGLNNWQADVIQYDFINDVDFVPGSSNPDDHPLAIATSGNEVTLTTVADNQFEKWSVVLFQEFTLSAAINSTILLSLDTLGQGDFFFAQLVDLSTLDIIDLTAGGSFDVTAWAGRDVSLEFGVQDLNFVLGDFFSVSNLSLTEQANDIPEPPLALALVVGVSLLLRRRQRDHH